MAISTIAAVFRLCSWSSVLDGLEPPAWWHPTLTSHCCRAWMPQRHLRCRQSHLPHAPYVLRMLGCGVAQAEQCPPRVPPI